MLLQDDGIEERLHGRVSPNSGMRRGNAPKTRDPFAKAGRRASPEAKAGQNRGNIPAHKWDKLTPEERHRLGSGPSSSSGGGGGGGGSYGSRSDAVEDQISVDSISVDEGSMSFGAGVSIQVEDDVEDGVGAGQGGGVSSQLGLQNVFTFAQLQAQGSGSGSQNSRDSSVEISYDGGSFESEEISVDGGEMPGLDVQSGGSGSIGISYSPSSGGGGRGAAGSGAIDGALLAAAGAKVFTMDDLRDMPSESDVTGSSFAMDDDVRVCSSCYC